jgi:hypothetical protein
MNIGTDVGKCRPDIRQYEMVAYDKRGKRYCWQDAEVGYPSSTLWSEE